MANLAFIRLMAIARPRVSNLPSLLTCRSLMVSAMLIALALSTGSVNAIQIPAGPATLVIPDAMANPANSNIDTLVFCPAGLQAPLKRWVDYRQQQGYQIQVLQPRPTAFGIKHQIATVAAANPSFETIVIVGDANPQETGAQFSVPTEYKLSRATVKFGAEPEIATDNPYADLDGDGVPDLSIGRMPVDNAQELTQFIERIIAYETRPSDTWQSRMSFIAGVGGFGKIVDSVIEQVAKKVITEQIPDHVKTSMTYGSWTSPYCPSPRNFSAAAIERFNEGCLFWVYIGHGDRTRLDRVHMPDQSHAVLDEKSVKKIDCRHGSPIAIFLACYTNSFDDEKDCLGESMLKQDHGPIAVIGGSRVTMPAGMGLLSMALLEEYYDENGAGRDPRRRTLGEVVLRAKRELVGGKREFSGYRKLIESIAGSLLPQQPFAAEQQDHVHLMQLLGDPLLAIKRSRPFELQATQTSDAQVHIKGDLELPAAMIANHSGAAVGHQVEVQLCYERDRLKSRFRRRRKYDSTDAAFAGFQQIYEQSRDLVCVRKMADIDPDGQFDIALEIPSYAKGRCVVIATAVLGEQYFAAAQKIEIKRKPIGRVPDKPHF